MHYNQYIFLQNVCDCHKFLIAILELNDQMPFLDMAGKKTHKFFFPVVGGLSLAKSV